LAEKSAEVLKGIQDWLEKKENIEFMQNKAGEEGIFYCSDGIHYLIQYFFQSEQEDLMKAGEEYFEGLANELKQLSSDAKQLSSDTNANAEKLAVKIQKLIEETEFFTTRSNLTFHNLSEKLKAALEGAWKSLENMDMEKCAPFVVVAYMMLGNKDRMK